MDSYKSLTKTYKDVEKATKQVEDALTKLENARGALKAANEAYTTELRDILYSLGVDATRARDYLGF